MAAQNGRLDGVYSYSFRQLMETIEPEAAKAEVNRILMKHLSSVKSIDVRLEFLLSLHDIVKNKK